MNTLVERQARAAAGTEPAPRDALLSLSGLLWRRPGLPCLAGTGGWVGCVAGGWCMAGARWGREAALEAGEGDSGFLEPRRITARFYADSILPEAPALAEVVMRSGPGCLDIADGQF